MNAKLLRQYSERLSLTLLEPYIIVKKLKPTQEEEDCVKAFCVLIHASLEEYFESLSQKTLVNSYKKYKTKKIISKIPINNSELEKLNNSICQLFKTLIISSGYAIYSQKSSEALKAHKSKLEEIDQIYKQGNVLTTANVSSLTKKTDSYAKEIIKDAVKYFDGHIADNHGASLKYILKLFIPVGIDIPEELSLLNSLQKIAEYRGKFAHTRGNLKQILSAPDVKLYLEDVLRLCEIIEKSLEDFQEYVK